MIAYSRYLFLLAAATVFSGCSKQREAAPAAPAKPAHAPDVYQVKFETSKGDFVVQVNKEWAPLGAERFYQLVQSGFYDKARFFRVLPGFMAQFGINADPNVSALWRTLVIADDPVKQSNTRGRITFAMRGPGTRTTQVFINYANNSRLDASGFAPFGEVLSGMEVVDSLYSGYGEGEPKGNGPRQDLMQTQGNPYLERSFPRLDYINKASVQ
jgi:cyclophilin family peptidyl-prolyl cis-trans isomerase